MLAQSQDSVGVALHVAAGNPRLGSALQDAFMAGFSTACVVVGVICLLGALGAVVFLPGREVQAPSEDAGSETARALAA